MWAKPDQVTLPTVIQRSCDTPKRSIKNEPCAVLARVSLLERKQKNKPTHFSQKHKENHSEEIIIIIMCCITSLLAHPCPCSAPCCVDANIYMSLHQWDKKTFFKLKTPETGTNIRVRALQSVARNTPRVLRWSIIYDESTEEVKEKHPHHVSECCLGLTWAAHQEKVLRSVTTFESDYFTRSTKKWKYSSTSHPSP